MYIIYWLPRGSEFCKTQKDANLAVIPGLQELVGTLVRIQASSPRGPGFES